MRFFLVAALSLTLAGVQDKTYDLKLDWKPVKGYRTALQETGDTRMTVQVAGQGVVFSEAEQTALAAVETVVSVDDAGGSERTWAFSSASKDKSGQKQPLGFAGRTVRVSQVKGKPRTFALEGSGVLSEGDLDALKKAFMGSSDDAKASGKPSGSDLFAPPRPVKVGESWSPDLKALAGSFLDDSMADAFHPDKSKAVLTLRSVERRDGVEFGKIDGVVELAVSQLGPMKLEEPMIFKVTMSLDVCVDGKVPDGTLAMTAEMKGTSMIDGPAGKLAMTFDMLATAKTRATTINSK
jgi:hypothetical protein